MLYLKCILVAYSTRLNGSILHYTELYCIILHAVKRAENICRISQPLFIKFKVSFGKTNLNG